MTGRYDNASPIKVNGKECITSEAAFVNRDIKLNKIKTIVIKYNGVDTLDKISNQYLGSPDYWWVIAKINNLYGNIWRIEPGAKLLIPKDVSEVLGYF